MIGSALSRSLSVLPNPTFPIWVFLPKGTAGFPPTPFPGDISGGSDFGRSPCAAAWLLANKMCCVSPFEERVCFAYPPVLVILPRKIPE